VKSILITALLIVIAGTSLASTIEGPGPMVNVTPYHWGRDFPGNVAVFMDQLPWGSACVTDVLQAYGISYSVYNSNSIGNLDLSPYDKAIIVSNQPTSFYNILGANQAYFENYMTGGGMLLECCAEYFGYGGSSITWPGGFTYFEFGANSVNIVDPTHPVFNDPLPVGSGNLQNWNYSSHGGFNNIPGGATNLITTADVNPGTVCAFAFQMGAGGGYATMQPFDWVGAGNPYAVNVVLYMGNFGPVPVHESSWGAIKALYH